MRTLTKEEIKNCLGEYQSTKHYGLKIGIRPLDQILRMDKKSLAVLTAKPNQGKSTFINFYCYQMAINNKWKTLYFNFETDNGRFISDLVKLYGDVEQVIEYCHIVNIKDITSLTDVFEAIMESKRTNNIDMCVIDPFMRLNGWLSDVNTYNIGKVLTDLQQIAINEDILLLIAAHPTKIKEGMDINPNDIMGSTYFYTVSDFIFSMNITDRENMFTEIRTLKIRNNLDMGICGASCLLQFDPFTKRYEEVKEDVFDEPFRKEGIEKKVMQEMTANKASQQPNGKEDAQQQAEEEIMTPEPKESEIEPIDIDNIKVSVYKTCNNKAAKEIISIKDAVKLGYEQIEVIDELRRVCEEKIYGWEIEKRELKQKLRCFTPSKNGYARQLRNNNEYNNIISFDIDEKENDKPTEEIRNILINDKYTLYCGVSASGRGLYGFYVGNGEVNDYKAQFDAMVEYLRGLGIKADASCSDVTRLRFASYDNRDYWNLHAKPFLMKSETTHNNHQMTISNDNLKVPQERNKLEDEERKWFDEVLKEAENEHLILTKNHEESNAIGSEIAYYYGEDGLDKYLTIRKQRKESYDESKSMAKYLNICKWIDTQNYERKGKLQTLRHFYNIARNERIDRLNSMITCGTFGKSN